MSSGSYFTLYRKYKAKITDAERADIEARYRKSDEEDCINKSAGDGDIAYSLPLVLDPKIGVKESVYNEQTKTWKDVRDYSINGLRANFLKVLKEDNSYLDELMTWNFNSSFSCLKNEWAMQSYSWDRCQHVIDYGTAKLMLQACNYLLSGKWSDETEKILDNKWIRIFADGNDCCSYWKYLYRNNKKRLREIESDEDSEDIEWQLKQMKSALEAFVNVDTEFLYDDKLEYVLVYTAW